jgi:hypothetical protein
VDVSHSIVAQRFTKWGIERKREHAVPVLIVGLDGRRQRVVLTTCTWIAPEEMRAMLEEAIRLIDAEETSAAAVQPEAARGLDT